MTMEIKAANGLSDGSEEVCETEIGWFTVFRIEPKAAKTITDRSLAVYSYGVLSLILRMNLGNFIC
jgi:hypothetical protein